jgi:iron complex outermembrane receptor protein
MSKKALLMSAAALLAMPQSLHAATGQPGSTENAPQAGAERSGQEIIVTARKREERLQDVPVAISAVTSADIERYSVNSLTAIAQQVPQLIIAESQNQIGGSVNLRGIGAGVSNPSTEQSSPSISTASRSAMATPSALARSIFSGWKC